MIEKICNCFNRKCIYQFSFENFKIEINEDLFYRFNDGISLVIKCFFVCILILIFCLVFINKKGRNFVKWTSLKSIEHLTRMVKMNIRFLAWIHYLIKFNLNFARLTILCKSAQVGKEFCL